MNNLLKGAAMALVLTLAPHQAALASASSSTEKSFQSSESDFPVDPKSGRLSCPDLNLRSVSLFGPDGKPMHSHEWPAHDVFNKLSTPKNGKIVVINGQSWEVVYPAKQTESIPLPSPTGLIKYLGTSEDAKSCLYSLIEGWVKKIYYIGLKPHGPEHEE